MCFNLKWIPSSVQILYCLRHTPYIPSPSLTRSLCLLFSEVYWLFRSKAKMKCFRQQPQKQPAIRGIFISIHGVSVSACLREREKGVSTLCSHSPVQQQCYRTHFWGWRTEHTAARFWCGGVCVCLGGIIAEDWGGWSAWDGCQEETETPTEAALRTDWEAVHFTLSSVIFLSDSRTTLSTNPWE